MSESQITYHCPICINHFTDEGVNSFQCIHKLCKYCDYELKINCAENYNCPLCRARSKHLEYKVTLDDYDDSSDYCNKIIHLSRLNRFILYILEKGLLYRLFSRTNRRWED